MESQKVNHFLWKNTDHDGHIPIINFSDHNKELSKNDLKDFMSIQECKKMPIISHFKKPNSLF